MRFKTDRKTDPDATETSEETTEQVAGQTSEPEAIGDVETKSDTEHDAESTDDTSNTKDVAESEDSSSGDGESQEVKGVKSPAGKRRIGRIEWSRVVVFGVLPVVAMVIASAAAYLKWQDAWVRDSGGAGIESVAAAKDSTVAMLSYQPDSVEKDLGGARDRLTGKFKDSYTQLVHDVVIPGAKKGHISAIATVPAVASVSATPNHAVVLVFVNQVVTVGNDAPTDTASTVRVTLDKSGGRWLISSFDPV